MQTLLTPYPGMVRTLWFPLIGVMSFAASLWAVHRYRLRHLAREFELDLKSRTAERARIARDLHDTLLGSFNGLLMHLEAASLLFPTRPHEAKQTLDNTIARAARVLDEGREALEGLRRCATQSRDLATLFGRLPEEFSACPAHPIAFRVEVEGAQRHLHPMVSEEVYTITREALRNAFQHSHGTQIEIELSYHARRFRLRVRDNGQGFDAATLASRSGQGHFGLQSMQERAELAGGKLSVWSAPKAGTELELTIPATRAYTRAERAR
jgi:signal transduction histidine kinase